MTDNKSSIQIDLRLLVLLLLVANIVTLFLWQPWDSSSTDKREISVTGSATIEQEPDEFTFSPNYEFTASSEDEVNKSVADKATVLKDELVELGLAEDEIEIRANSYDYYWYDEDEDKHRGFLYLTISSDSKEEAERVQEYLLSTSAKGQITPRANFSKQALKDLESKARTAAIEDARKSAEGTAEELDSKLGKVISISDADEYSSGFEYGYLDVSRSASIADSVSEEAPSSIPVSPGQQEFNFKVKAVFEIK